MNGSQSVFPLNVAGRLRLKENHLKTKKII